MLACPYNYNGKCQVYKNMKYNRTLKRAFLFENNKYNKDQIKLPLPHTTTKMVPDALLEIS